MKPKTCYYVESIWCWGLTAFLTVLSVQNHRKLLLGWQIRNVSLSHSVAFKLKSRVVLNALECWTLPGDCGISPFSVKSLLYHHVKVRHVYHDSCQLCTIGPANIYRILTPKQEEPKRHTTISLGVAKLILHKSLLLVSSMSEFMLEFRSKGGSVNSISVCRGRLTSRQDPEMSYR